MKREALAIIVEQTADAVLVTNRDGRIEYVNPSFERLTGYGKEEAVGKTPALIKSGEHNTAFYQTLWQTILSGKPFYGILINRKKNGELYYSRKTITPLRTEGVITHFVSTDKDITEAKIAEEALKQRAEELARSNEDLDYFAHFVAHDLQEPARMVALYLELLRKKIGPLNEDCLNYFNFAREGGIRMQNMTNNMLQYSQINRKANFDAVDLEKVFQESVQDLTVAILESKADITHDPLPTVKGDKILLRQLFQNLLSNALKYRDENPPKIEIKARKKDNEWILSIKDNGIGMEEDDLKRVFTLFNRGHDSAKYSGSGIGLSLCRRIVTHHGGRIWVESKVNQGSTFYFTLPTK